MPTVWPDRSVVRVHTHSERVLGSSLGRVMRARGVNATREEKAYDLTGTPTQDLWHTAANSLTTSLSGHKVSMCILQYTRQGSCTLSKVCRLPHLSGKMWIQKPMRAFILLHR